MSQLIAMFCDIDDFCKTFEPIYTQRLLQSGQRQRARLTQLSLSEIMTPNSQNIRKWQTFNDIKSNRGRQSA